MKNLKNDLKIIEEERCDYCGKKAKYRQTFDVYDIATEETEVCWIRSACEIHKDHCED